VNLRGVSVLELGGGAGLVGMVAAVLGASVTVTEQQSCMPYLLRNRDLNKHTGVDFIAKALFWEACPRDGKGKAGEKGGGFEDRFDLVVGCDITYDPSLFEALISTLYMHLAKGGLAWICHDNDSCPLSKTAEAQLGSICAKYDLHFVTWPLKDIMPPEFFQKSICMWKIEHV